MGVSDIVLPFLKWAGGKRWLTSSYPEIFHQPFNRYIEPFLGSGAVFFHLRPRLAILSDINEELIEAYQAIKDDWIRVYSEMRKHHRNHSKEYYYSLRSLKPRNRYTRAARFIYLNRTCWNGLYRVNLRGEFNVPLGTKTSVLLNTDDFRSISERLLNTDLRVSDFESIIDEAGPQDFLFVDPPYTVKHNLNGFIKYNETIFSWDDQVRLRDALLRANRRGVKILATNANHKSVVSLFKGDFELMRAKRASVLAGDKKYRGSVSELLILANY